MSAEEVRRKLEAKKAELKALDETLSGLWFKREKLFQEIEAIERELQQRRQESEGRPDL